MNADAHVNLLRAFALGIVCLKLGLNQLGALHGMHDGGEVYQESVPHGLDDRASMRGDRLLDDLVMHGQQPQGAGFIGTHLATKADDVGEHNRR